MTGDVQDLIRRMRAVLPRGWFSDTSSVTDGVLGATGAAWQAIYTLILAVIGLARISTATGPFLDMISADFFAADLPESRGKATDRSDKGYNRNCCECVGHGPRWMWPCTN